MPKSPDTSTIIVAGSQYKVTIPKGLAEALNLKSGQKIKWKVLGAGRLELNVN